jgi:hypothetical protein
MPRRALPVLPLVALAAALLGGCGDGSLSASQLHSQASAICARANAATDRIALPSTADEGGRFLRDGLAQLRPAAARLGALKAPTDLRRRYDRAVQLARQEIALIARHERAIVRGEDAVGSFRSLETALDPLTTEENAYWRGLGIPSCVRS